MLRKNKNWCKAKKYKSVVDFPLKIAGIINDCLVYGHEIFVQWDLKTNVSSKAYAVRIADGQAQSAVTMIVLKANFFAQSNGFHNPRNASSFGLKLVAKNSILKCTHGAIKSKAGNNFDVDTQ